MGLMQKKYHFKVHNGLDIKLQQLKEILPFRGVEKIL